MQTNQKTRLSNLDVFKLWLYANSILTLLFIVIASLATKYTHDGLFDKEMIIWTTIYGFAITVPSLTFLFIANYFYKKKYTSIPLRCFYTNIIIFINFAYLLVTEIISLQLVYLMGYIITTIAGILSLQIITKKLKGVTSD